MQNNQMIVQEQQSALSIIESMNLNKVQHSMAKIKQFQQVVQNALVSGHDYGESFYGAKKPSLLKPGAEKILMLLGLSSEYEIIEQIQDYEEGFFAYTIKCILKKNEQVITQGLGHCNSREKKYTSEKQDFYILGNTCLKMAKKRAQVDAVLTVASLSDIFTQDLEDMAEFEENERIETMNLEDALNMKIRFGKYKGKTLGEIFNKDKKYIEWLKRKADDEVIRKACEIIENQSTHQASNNINNNPNIIEADTQQMGFIDPENDPDIPF